MSKETTEETGLAINTLTVDKIPNVLESLKAQLKTLKGDTEKLVDHSYNGISIKSVKTVKELLEISASIHQRARAYEEEVERYELKDSEKYKIAPFSQNGLSVSQWETIIKQAIFDLLNKVHIERLEKAIEKLSTHLSAEQKLKNDLESIMQSVEVPIL